jgi:hypothetical protein
LRGWPGVTPAAISTDRTAGAPLRPWLTSAELHSQKRIPLGSLLVSTSALRAKPFFWQVVLSLTVIVGNFLLI